MTHQEKLAFIRWKCIEAGAEIELKGCTCKLMHDENGCLVGKHYRSVRIADVLLAIGNKYSIQGSGHFMWHCNNLEEYEELGWNEIFEDEYRRKWNLRKDSLDEQDESTISFLYDILK